MDLQYVDAKRALAKPCLLTKEQPTTGESQDETTPLSLP